MNAKLLLLMSLLWAVSWMVASGAENDPRLPMSAAELGSAVEASNTVTVCKLVSLGWVNFMGPSVSRYDEAVFEVRDQLKGTAPTRLVCPIVVRADPLPESEQAPKEGTEYIVAASVKDGKFELQKLLQATQENTAATLKLIQGERPNPMRDAPQKQGVAPKKEAGSDAPPARMGTMAGNVVQPSGENVIVGADTKESRLRSAPWVWVALCAIVGGMLYYALRKIADRNGRAK